MPCVISLGLTMPYLTTKKRLANRNVRNQSQKQYMEIVKRKTSAT